MSGEPYFSIGITTYKRRELLGETLASVLAQSFGDFEVIIGNDDPGLPLSAEMLGVNDPRLRIVNHPTNLGEMANMNALLGQGRGRYFSWLADDDLYEPGFLRAVSDAHRLHGPLPCVFGDYASGAIRSPVVASRRIQHRLYTGREFLRGYLASRIRAIGCYGVFEIGYLRRLGGMEQLGSGFSPYSDNLLVIRAGLLEQVGYIDAPLLFFRTHAASISYSSPDLEAYLAAQQDFCARAVEVFKAPQLASDFRRNLYDLLGHWCLGFLFSVLRRDATPSTSQLSGYARFLVRQSRGLGIFRVRLAAMVLTLTVKHLIFLLRRNVRGDA